MSKTTGLGWTTFTVEDSGGSSARDIRNDCRSLDFETPRGVQDVTGLDKFAFERLLLLADFSATPKGVFNDAANMSHDVFSTCSSSSVVRAVNIVITGSAGTNTLANECLITNYQLARSEEGELTWEAPMVLADGTVPTWS